MNKNLMIGLGVLAVAGIAYYMYKKPKATTTTGEEPKAGATGKPKMGTVRNPIPSDLIRPCGGATVQGHYKCCKSGEGVVGYSLYPSCENLVATLPSEG